jgi:hypothetical protein
MSASLAPQRILVCGTPRSGTTLAQRSVVANLDGAVSGPETHAYAVGAGDVLHQLSAWARRGSAAGSAFYDAMWARLTASSPVPARFVVEKTPNHLRWLPAFLDHDRQLVALVVEKPVAAATASLAHAGYGPVPLAVAYAHVRFDRVVTGRLRRDHPRRVGVIALHDLAAEERTTISEVFSEWGIEPAAVPDATRAVNLVNDDETWKAESLTPGDTMYVDRALKSLPAVQRSRLVALAHLHAAHHRASGRDVPPLADTIVTLGWQAPRFLSQLVLIRAKHLVVRTMLAPLFVGRRAT